MTSIFKGITTRIYGIIISLTCSPLYIKWFEQLGHNWSPIITKIDMMDLVSSHRTPQSSQFSNSMPSPTTSVASNQSSQLEHSSDFSNPSLKMKEASSHFIIILSPSPHLQGLGGVENHPLLSLSPQPLPPHIKAHSYIRFTAPIYPCPCPLFMTLLLCIDEFSINKKVCDSIPDTGDLNICVKSDIRKKI